MPRPLLFPIALALVGLVCTLPAGCAADTATPLPSPVPPSSPAATTPRPTPSPSIRQATAATGTPSPARSSLPTATCTSSPTPSPAPQPTATVPSTPIPTAYPSLPPPATSPAPWTATATATPSVTATPACSPGPQDLVPGQFIAKMFTEALGQTPPQPRWQEWAGFFQENGCSEVTLRSKVVEIYTGPAYGFAGLYADPAARLLALYRGALNREPDAAGFQAFLRHPGPWEALVADFLAYYGPEFAALSCEICAHPGTAPWYEEAIYGWSGHYAPLTPPTMPVDDCGLPPEEVLTVNSEDELRRRLAGATPGQTVYLAQKVVVELSAPVVIPDGVTLATCQTPEQVPTPEHYALMGRLVRASLFEGPLVRISTAGRLDMVWVDGQQAQRGSRLGPAINVWIADYGNIPGGQTMLTHSRLSDSSGWTQVYAPGSYESRLPCANVYIGGNLLTGYANDHYGGKHVDGMSIACENTTVEGNRIVDASDVSIVIFRCGAGCVQRSQVRYNTILNAGNSAFGALTVDPLVKGLGLNEEYFQVHIEHNVLWTGPTAHVDVAISLGTRAWYGLLANVGRGPDCGAGPCPSVVLADNTTQDPQSPAEVTLRCNTPIAISGMRDVCLSGNDLAVETVRTTSCPRYDPRHWPGIIVFANVCCPQRQNCICGEWASFSPNCAAPPYRDVNIGRCIGHIP